MDLTKVTGLWKNTDKNGKPYLSGSLTPITNLMVMPNTFKKPGDKAPDFYVYIAPREKQEKKADDNTSFNI